MFCSRLWNRRKSIVPSFKKGRSWAILYHITLTHIILFFRLKIKHKDCRFVLTFALRTSDTFDFQERFQPDGSIRRKLIIIKILKITLHQLRQRSANSTQFSPRPSWKELFDKMYRLGKSCERVILSRYCCCV
jgi:hypothetical protein